MEKVPPQRFKRRVRPLCELKKSTRNERKRAIEQVFREATNTLPDDVTNVTVNIDFQGGINMTFSPTTDTEELGGKLATPPHNLETLQQLIFIKDRYRISDAALHEIHMLYSQIPPKNQICDERKRLSGTIPIQGPVEVHYKRSKNLGGLLDSCSWDDIIIIIIYFV